MKLKVVWKAALVAVIVISAVLLAPSLLKMYELSDSMIRILGVADILALFVCVFAFVKSYAKH